MDTCAKGLHPFTPENSIINPTTGKRRCRACTEEYRRTRVTPPCSIDECDLMQLARTWCKKHYRLWEKYGDPYGPAVTDVTEPGEQWRPVVGWEDLYLVSSHGRVWSARRRMLLSLYIGMYGYQEVKLGGGAKSDQKTQGVHRMVAAAFIGPRPKGPSGQCIRHLDGNKLNNRPSNLAYGTDAENLQDEMRHGTHVNLRFAERAACKNGHEYQPGSWYTNKANARVCRQCDRDKIERYRLRKAAQTVAELAGVAEA